ncbi:MAG: hypothetical protein IJL87_02785 [Clostridia bacterium]|nr:hypothetical protein [Clostridia bacterium]
MATNNDFFQFGLFGYSKKDVELKFDMLREQFSREREALIEEKRSLEKDVAELREKESEFMEKNERFEEVERSVSSIMSVTQRASEKVFDEAQSQREVVAGVVSDAADQIVSLRNDIVSVRENMNKALGELQDRLDTIDKTLVSSVTRLVSVKHDVLKSGSSAADIHNEVERLLELASRNMDITTSTGQYRVPTLGQFGASLVSESAAKVVNSRKNAYYGVADDDTAGELGSLVKEVDYQLAEATAKGTRKNGSGFLNNVGADAPDEENAPTTGLLDSAADASKVVPEPIVAAALSDEPDWFTASPLISKKASAKVVPVRETRKSSTSKVKVKKVQVRKRASR